MLRKKHLHSLVELFNIQTRLWAKEWNKNDQKGVSLSHVVILELLADEGPKQPKELGEVLYITSGGITVVTNKLIKAGYIQRNRDEQNDRRAVFFTITELGKEILQIVRGKKDKQLDKFYKTLTDEEVEILNIIYKKVVQDLQSGKSS